MSLTYLLRGDSGSFEDITDRVRLYTLDVSANAEEASVGTSTIVIDDPNGDYSFAGHRAIKAVEGDVAATSNTVVWVGYTAERELSRGPYLTGTGRIWTTTVSDLNVLLDRKVLQGSEANRPAETDVARMQWVATAFSLIEDTTYLDTSNPVAMDAVDYRGQRLGDVVNDCMQASGKNAFMWYKVTSADGTGDPSLFYGDNDLEVHSSILRLSNDLDDIDNLTTFGYDVETSKLVRDPSRVYSGLYMQWDGGTTYVHSNATQSAFALGGRDATLTEYNIKTTAKAEARANRYLGDYSTESDTITAAFYVPSTHVNHLMAGMRVQFKGTHIDGYENFTWMRCLNRRVEQVAETEYKVTVDLAGPGIIGDQPATPASPGGGDPNYVGNLQVTVPLSGTNGSDSEQDWGDTQPKGTVYLYQGCVYRFVFTNTFATTAARNGGTHRITLPGIDIGPEWVSGSLAPSSGKFNIGSELEGYTISAFDATFDKATGGPNDPVKVSLVLAYVSFSGCNGRGSTSYADVYYVSGPDPRF